MRVAFINSVAGVGSTGRIVYQLSQMEGLQGKLYYGRKENPTDADVFRITGTKGIAMHAMMTFLKDDHGFENRKETLQMVENLKEYNPDLIHLHNLHGYYLDVEPLFQWLKDSGKPVIWTFHDCWPFTGHCAHFDAFDCNKWKTECIGKCPATGEYPWTFNPYMVNRNYKRKKELFTSLPDDQMTIVTPSFWLGDLVKQSFMGKYAVETIHNGLNPERFRPTDTNFREQYGLNDRFLILACAGSWSKQKGLDDLVSLSSRLKENQVLVVVGVTNRQKRLFKSEQVICINHTESIHELLGMYTAADVFINLTYQDTFPTVNLEAQSCGLPVITYETGGSPESLSQYSGMVVPKGDLETVEYLLEKMQKKEIIIARSSCRSQSLLFTEANMLAAYRSLYMHKTGEIL